LQVIDNGPGIPEDPRRPIFYPLVPAARAAAVSGLTLAQSFVQQHGGVIECESRPGRTVFTIAAAGRGGQRRPMNASDDQEVIRACT
jgi:two-component system nitrogen regulation sensor histidine kinase GlnL